jgi:hypothetical protein
MLGHGSCGPEQVYRKTLAESALAGSTISAVSEIVRNVSGRSKVPDFLDVSMSIFARVF